MIKSFGIFHISHGKSKGLPWKDFSRNDKGVTKQKWSTSVLFLEHCRCSIQHILDSEMRWSSRFRESEAAFVCKSVLKALHYLHSRCIVHRDVKSANILVSAGGGRILLCDFNLAIYLPPGKEEFLGGPAGTPGFMAPESFKEKATFSPESDMFALGAVLYQLLFGVAAFVRVNLCMTKWATETQTFPLKPCGRAVGRSDSSCSLVRNLVEYNPSKRPSAQIALGCKWLQYDVDPCTTLSSLMERIETESTMSSEMPVKRTRAAKSDSGCEKRQPVRANAASRFAKGFSGVSSLISRVRCSLCLVKGRSSKVAPEFHGV